jgi:hypothetical protein
VWKTLQLNVLFSFLCFCGYFANFYQLLSFCIWNDVGHYSEPLERPRRRWEDNIRIDTEETGWDVVDWLRLAQNRIQWRDLLKNVMVNVLFP